jgi:vitamin B12 transporter
MKNPLFLKTACAVSLVLCPHYGYANNNTDTLIVTATRNPQNKNAIGSSVTVLDSETLSRRGDVTVADALKRVSGISISRLGGIGSNSDVRMRGTDAGEVKVLIDGVDISDSSSPKTSFDFESLMVDNIDRIEILRGNQSALYGSSAIGGVINIFTKRADKNGVSGNGYAQGGSFGTVQTGGSLNAKNEIFSVHLNTSHLRSDGFSRTDTNKERDATKTTAFNAGIDAQVTDNLLFGVSGGHENLRSEYDEYSNPDEVYDKEFYHGQAFGQYVSDNKKITQKLTLNTSDTKRDYSNGYYDGDRKGLNYQADFNVFTRDTATIGADYGIESAKVKYVDWAKKTSFIKQDVGNKSLYGQYVWGITDDLTATMGVRGDDYDNFGTHGTYRTALAYNIDKTGTILRASYGTGFRAPSLYNLFDPTYGNIALKPEKTKGFDVGFEQTLIKDTVVLSSTYFKNDIDNLFSFDPATSQSINIGQVESQGFETTLDFYPVDWATFFINHTYTDAKNKTTNTVLSRRPMNIVNIGGDFDVTDKFKIGALGHFVGHQYDYNPATFGTVKTSSYFTADLTSSYDVTDNVTAYGRVENILDKDYQEVLGYNTAGVSAFGGLRVKF